MKVGREERKVPLPEVGGWNCLRALASSSAAWMALIVRSVAGGSV